MSNSLDWIFKKEFLNELKSDINDKDQENRYKTIWFMKDLTDTFRPPPQHLEEDYEYDMRDLRIFWTACVYFHRFYVFHNFNTHPRFPVAVACLFLASKVEEKQLRLVDHIYLYFKVRHNKQLSKKSEEFIDMEKKVLLMERILLQTLNFDLTISHPQQYFKQIITKDIKVWFGGDNEGSKQVIRLATTLSSDSFRSNLCLLYSPHQISLALVFLALVILDYKPTNSSQLNHHNQSSNSSNSYKNNTFSNQNMSSIPMTQSSSEVTWIEIFEKDIDADVLQSICYEVLELYKQNQVNQLPFTRTTNDIDDHLIKEFSNKSKNNPSIPISSNHIATITMKNNHISSYSSSLEESKNNTISIESQQRISMNNNIIRPPVPISDFTIKPPLVSTSSNQNTILTLTSLQQLNHNLESSIESKIVDNNEIINNNLNEHHIVTTYHNNYHDDDLSNDDNDIDGNDDINNDIDGNETPYEIPLPSDTPCTMGTCTPSFDYLPIISNTTDISNHLGKRTREEY